MNFYEKEPVSLYLEELTLLEDFVSSKQHIQLFLHPWLGKVLVINGEIQHIEKYQPLYHEMLVHLPAAFVPHLDNVLILGGGSLFAAKEVLKYHSVKHLVLCDYDHTVLEVMKKYYPHVASILQDPRFEYVEKDGRAYLRSCSEKYDLIINDCFNLERESRQDGLSYYRLISSLCSSQGVCVDIIYRHIFDRPTTIRTLKHLKAEENLALSLVVVPEYPGILHLETIWGKSEFISQNLKEPINDNQVTCDMIDPETFSYYNPGNLAAYLYLPPYIKEMFTL